MLANKIESVELDNVRRCGTSESEIHIYSGILELAMALEVPFEVKENDGSAYPVRIEFEYEGYTVFQIEKDTKVLDYAEICDS